MNQQMATQTTPSRLTPGKGLSPLGLWKVEASVQRTGYEHRWSGDASNSEDAKAQALDSARRAWPGFSFVIRSVVQVA